VPNLPVYFILALAGLQTLAAGQEAAPALMLGAYAHPGAFWERGERLDDFGVNAVFIHSGGLDDDTIQRARAEGCRVFAEFATLNGQYGDYVLEHPEAHPIDDSGEPVAPATWFLGACPTDPGFRAFRMSALRDLLTRFDVDGVWMDYLHWHAQFEDPYPIFVKTCFNESCLGGFQQSTGLHVQGETVAQKARWIFMNAASQWEDWRVSVLVDWAREIHDTVKELRPNALVGNFQVAWKDEDLGGVRRRCLGLDFRALRPYVDVFSPMTTVAPANHQNTSASTSSILASTSTFAPSRATIPVCGPLCRLTTNRAFPLRSWPASWNTASAPRARVS